LTDPGAEAQITAPNPNPTLLPGWSLFNGATFNNSVAHSGSWSIELSGGGWAVPGAYQSFPAAPGQQFTMSGYGLTPTPLAPLAGGFPWTGLQISYFNAGGADIGTVETGGVGAYAPASAKITDADPANVWKYLTVTATAPAGAASVQVFAITLDSVPTTGFFDDLTLVPEPTTFALAGLGAAALLIFRRRS
jgi:hypothetical protein